METRKIIKSGCSLAVVIPASVVEQLKLKKGDTVAWVNEKIVKIEEVKCI
jgi:antitoxin component of MazEF toxin-antitoxin module